MIKVIEKNYLNDNNINIMLVDNISINDKIIFNKNDLYYFGNYDKDMISFIKNKINNNKNNIRNAVEKGVKFIITGNSYDLFNNTFKCSNINLFNAYNKKMFKRKRIKLKKTSKRIKEYNNLYNIDNENFKYKNLICIKNKMTK